MGMLFHRTEDARDVASPSVRATTEEYVATEKARSRAIASKFRGNQGILVWGTGDNFCRSAENEGPPSGLSNMVVLDRSPKEIQVGGQRYRTEDPLETIRSQPWPVVITISEGRESLLEQVRAIDPDRDVTFI
jgi:hypothetical protein